MKTHVVFVYDDSQDPGPPLVHIILVRSGHINHPDKWRYAMALCREGPRRAEGDSSWAWADGCQGRISSHAIETQRFCCECLEELSRLAA